MNWFDDYLSNIDKKKKKEEEDKEKLSAASQNDIAPIGSSYLQGGSAVPVSGTAPYAAASGLNLAPVKLKDEDKPKWYEGYVKKGAYEDGAQKHDLERTILGTTTDVAKNLLQGVVGMAETTIDAFAGIAPVMMEQQLAAEGSMYSEGEKKLYLESLEKAKTANEGFVKKELIDEDKVANQILAARYAGMNVLKAKDRYAQAMGYMSDEVVDGEIVAPSKMEQNSVLDEKTDALIQSAGQLAAQAGLQAAGVPWWVTSATTAYGSEFENALKEGATAEEANLSALVTAAAEVLTEQIGGIKFKGKALDDNITKALARGISDKFLRTAAKVGLDTTSEGFEELITQIAGEFGQWLSYRNDEELKDVLWSEEAIQAKIDAAFGGALIGGGFGTVNAARAANKGLDYASEMTNNEKAVVDAVYKELVDAEAAGTESGELTGKRKKEIYNEVVEQLERGDFNVETIEKVLGGKDLQNYQKAEAERAKLQKEYDELYGMRNKSNKQIDREAYLKERLESEENNARRDELKKKYTEGVQAMALQDRLGESYRQKGERGRAYEADLNQYTGKAKETVQKAVESGILNNTRKTHDFVDLIAKIAEHTGRTFDFTNNQRLKESSFAIEGKQVNGYITKDGITLNINSPKALNRVVGHEVMHVLQEAGLAETLTKKIFAYAESKGELASRREAVADLYKGRTTDIDGELAADLVGDYLFTNKDFVRQLNTENRTAFDKIWDEIKYLCKVATAGSKEARELARIEKMFGEVYRETGTKKPTDEDGEARYSFMGYAEDGKGIYESNFPKGTPKKAKGERILKYIQDVWSKKPITLRIKDGGETRYIEAQFDPTYSDDKNVRTDASKLMGGNRHGNATEQRVTLDLADDYYQIASESEYNYSKDETGKETDPHLGVKQWHYFVNDIYFAEQGSEELVPYRVSINIKEKNDGNFIYSFSAEKTKGTSTRRTLHAAVNDSNDATANGSSSKLSISEAAPNVNTENELAPVRQVSEVYGRDIGIDAPVREDLYGDVPEEFFGETDEAFDAMLDEIEIRDTRQRLDAIREHSQQELEANQQHRQEAKERYDRKIAKAQQQYDAKKNKESKLAQDLLKRIERLKRLQADVDAGYSKRISDIQRRLKKTDLELEKDHSRKDSYQRAIARIDRNLEQDKAALEEEYRGQMEIFEDKNGWISKRSTELYQELRHLKKGKRASGELSYLLDLRQERGWSWDTLRAALVNVRHTPDRAVNMYSPAEQAVRELLQGSFESDMEAAELDYEEQLTDLEAEAEEKRIAARTSNQAKVKHEQHVEEVKRLIGDTSTWRDKPLGIQYATNTEYRNILDVVRGPDGKPDREGAQAIYDYLGGSYNHNEAEYKKKLAEIQQWYQEQNITKEESVYIQMLGEMLYNPDTELSMEVVEDYLQEHKKKIDVEKVYEVIEQARADYDVIFEWLNGTLREAGMKEIDYRKGYFPHLKVEAESGLLGKLLDWKKSNNEIPTSIAGMTEGFTPNRSYQSFNKQRTGDATEYDFLKGFDAYMHGALDWIYHIEDIQRRREFENYIRYVHSEEGIKEQIEKVYENPYLNADEQQAEIDRILGEAANPLGNFVTDMRTRTNLLAAKKHSLDRGMEQLVNRDVYSVASNISNRVSANMVAGSLSAAMSNFIPITQSWGEVNPQYTIAGLTDAIKSIVYDDGIVERSDFLTNRLLDEEKLSQDFWDKAGDAVGWLTNGVDHLVSQTVWRSKYRQNLAQGMSENAAIRNADQFAENLMAGRSRGNQPTLFESKNLVTKMFTAFQLEVNNQYQYLFKDMPRALQNETKGKLVGAYAKVFIGAYLYNALSTVVTGREQAFDPIRILQRLLEGIADEEEDDSEDIVAFAEDVLENTPFVGGLMGGGRVPISSALPYDGNFMEGITGVAKAWETKDWKDWKAVLKELENPLYYLLPPMAGGQIRKTVQGLDMFIGDQPTTGSYTTDGALRYEVDPTAGNVLQAALFGQWANQNAQEYIKEGRTPLSEKQLEEFFELDVPMQEYWQIRDGLKGLKTINEKADYIASLNLSTKQKNLLINNIADRKTTIDMANYDKYADFEEMDFAVKKPELYKWLKSQGMTVKDYEASGSAKKDAYSWAAQNPQKYTVSRAVTEDLTAYRVYTKKINSIEGDKDAEGKTISGSRQKKVVEYINGLNLDYGARIILYRMAYQSDDSYNYEIVEYLNSRKDLTYNDMKTILEELGMAVDKEGRVTW